MAWLPNKCLVICHAVLLKIRFLKNFFRLRPETTALYLRGMKMFRRLSSTICYACWFIIHPILKTYPKPKFKKMARIASVWIAGSHSIVFLQNHSDGRDGGNKRKYRTQQGLKILNVLHKVTFHQKQKFLSRSRIKLKSKIRLC